MGQGNSKEEDLMRMKRQKSFVVGRRLQHEYQSLKEGKERVSVAQLRKLERKSAGDDKRRTKEIDEKIKQTFDEKQEISFSDFLKWKTEAGSADDLTEIWRELFKLIDNDDGQLTAQELVSIEESLGVNISEAEATEIIQRYDTDGNNLLSLEEFIFYKESQC